MDSTKIICSGALFYARDTSRFLFLHRTQGRTKNSWGLVGGTNEINETPWTALQREIQEEISLDEHILKTVPLETYLSRDEGFCYHTYLCLVEKEFIPHLNGEHDGWAWVSYRKWPQPLHKGLKNTLQSKANSVKISTVIEISELI